MYVLRWGVPCVFYDLRGNDGSLLIEVENPREMKENILTPYTKVGLFLHPRAVSG